MVFRRWRKGVVVRMNAVVVVIHALQRRRWRQPDASALHLRPRPLMQLIQGVGQRDRVRFFVMSFDVGDALESQRAFAAGDGVVAPIIPEIRVDRLSRRRKRERETVLLLLLSLMQFADNGGCVVLIRLL